MNFYRCSCLNRKTGDNFQPPTLILSQIIIVSPDGILEGGGDILVFGEDVIRVVLVKACQFVIQADSK